MLAVIHAFQLFTLKYMFLYFICSKFQALFPIPSMLVAFLNKLAFSDVALGLGDQRKTDAFEQFINLRMMEE